jgi:hypothetical protein
MTFESENINEHEKDFSPELQLKVVSYFYPS